MTYWTRVVHIFLGIVLGARLSHDFPSVALWRWTPLVLVAYGVFLWYLKSRDGSVETRA